MLDLSLLQMLFYTGGLGYPEEHALIVFWAIKQFEKPNAMKQIWTKQQRFSQDLSSPFEGAPRLGFCNLWPNTRLALAGKNCSGFFFLFALSHGIE